MSTATRRAAGVAALLVAILAAATTSIEWRPTPDAVATWWPAAGLSVALLVRCRRTTWPALVLGVAACTTLASVMGGRPLTVSLLMGAVNAAEALAVAGVLLRGLPSGSRPRPLVGPEGYVRVLVAAAAGAAVVGLGTAAAMEVVGDPVLASVRTVAPSHLAALLVIVPL
ncbi:MAG: tmoS, partial [Frankiales bacterium]|nr:tmoS [Frankiales bacterium]